MKRKNIVLKALTCGITALAFTACTDTWDNHYQPKTELNATETLWDLIEADPQLTQFEEFVKATGYDEEEGYADEGISLQTLDEAGRTTASYYWYDSAEDEMYGWYDDEGEYVEGVFYIEYAGARFIVNLDAGNEKRDAFSLKYVGPATK